METPVRFETWSGEFSLESRRLTSRWIGPGILGGFGVIVVCSGWFGAMWKVTPADQLEGVMPLDQMPKVD